MKLICWKSDFRVGLDPISEANSKPECSSFQVQHDFLTLQPDVLTLETIFQVRENLY